MASMTNSRENLKNSELKRKSEVGIPKTRNALSVFYSDNRGIPWHAKNGEKRKTSEDIVSKSCWARCNITWERGWSPISSLAPFWPEDKHTVLVGEREWLKPVTQPVWLVQTPRRLSRKFNRILTRFLQRFFFSLLYHVPVKTSVIRVSVFLIPLHI